VLTFNVRKWIQAQSIFYFLLLAFFQKELQFTTTFFSYFLEFAYNLTECLLQVLASPSLNSIIID
jgi:hypothetical protein